VKPPPFVYYAPDTLEEVLSLLTEHGIDGKVLAGGQSLLPMMNMRLARPKVLVDIGKLSGLSGITVNGGVTIGTTTTQAAVLRDLRIGDRLPMVHAAVRNVGHPANRARGTFGGSVAHADPAAELPAVMLALDAEMRVQSPGGERVVPAEDFFVTYYTTELDVDEVLTAVHLPDRSGWSWGFQEVARRLGDYAAAGVAVAAKTDAAGLVEEARIALFAVSDRPQRATEAEERLVGTRLGDEDVARDVAQLALRDVDFSSDIHVSDAYRKDAVVALVRRTVLDAAANREA
jgi:carbon-monoxide dehydrogenase medium subunit